MNPLSRIPKRQDLPKGPSLYEYAKSIAPNVVREMEKPAREVRDTGKLLYNAAMGEDAEGLPLGAEFIPGVSLAAKLKQGKTPGLFDILDMPSVKGITGLKALGALKAANLAVNPDLIKLLGKWIRSTEFEKRFAMLPKAVRESWAASFGDLHNTTLGEHRRKLRPDEGLNDLLHEHPVLGGGLRDYGGLYYPMSTDTQITGKYTPKIFLSDNRTYDRTPDLIHEGTHLMDEVLGTTSNGMKPIREGTYPYYHPFTSDASEQWIDDITRHKRPFNKAESLASLIQEDTGKFSPIYYKQELWDGTNTKDSPAWWWLSDDPHGSSHFKRTDGTINEGSVATEGLAQFVESIPYGFNTRTARQTPAYRSLVEYAEADPRRSTDFIIDYDPMLRDLEKKLNHGRSFKDYK